MYHHAKNWYLFKLLSSFCVLRANRVSTPRLFGFTFCETSHFKYLHLPASHSLAFPFILLLHASLCFRPRTDPGFAQVSSSFLQTALSTRTPKWRRKRMILRITFNLSLRKNVGSNSTRKEAPEMDIDPENEVKGIKLLLIHTGICLCTFLVGLVSRRFHQRPSIG